MDSIKEEHTTTPDATPSKKKRIENAEQQNAQTSTPAKKKQMGGKEPHKAKQETDKVNSKNPFAKKQLPNKNTVNQKSPAANRFNKNNEKQKSPGANPFNKQQTPKQDAVGQASGANPFRKPGKKDDAPRRPGGAATKPRSKHDFKAKGKPNNSNPNGISDDRLKAYGINPRKFHNRQKYGKKSQ